MDDDEEIRPALGVVELQRWARMREARLKRAAAGVPAVSLPADEVERLQVSTQLLAEAYWRAFDQVAQVFALDRYDRVGVLGIDDELYEMCEFNGSIAADSIAGRQVAILVEIYTALAPGRSADEIARWLRTPQPGLGDFLPIHRLRSTAVIRRVLEVAKAAPPP